MQKIIFLIVECCFLKDKNNFYLGNGLYFLKKQKNVLWDVNNKKYLDFSLMGVGTNILGYSNSQVNEKLKKTIKESNIST